MKNRKRLITVSAFILLVIITLFIWGRSSQKVNVAATFIGYTNGQPNEIIALLNIQNLGSHSILPFECQHNGELRSMPVDYVPAKSSRQFKVRLQVPVEEASKLKLSIRLKDSAMEEFREGLDSVLKSIRIRVPGLNPNSIQDPEVIECAIPPYP